MTTSLTEFILARNVEREAVALAATVAPWSDARGVVESPGVPVAMQPGWNRSVLVARNVLDRDAAHIALNDPAHVLAWCETVRRIVEWAENPPCWYAPCGLADKAESTDALLLALALPDAEHPDFDPAWRV